MRNTQHSPKRTSLRLPHIPVNVDAQRDQRLRSRLAAGVRVVTNQAVHDVALTGIPGGMGRRGHSSCLAIGAMVPSIGFGRKVATITNTGRLRADSATDRFAATGAARPGDTLASRGDFSLPGSCCRDASAGCLRSELRAASLVRGGRGVWAARSADVEENRQADLGVGGCESLAVPQCWLARASACEAGARSSCEATS